MKILLYGINFSPELTGIGKYSGEMADWLTAHGHQVRVVCAPPYYPDWAVSPGYSAWKYQMEHRNGVKVWRSPLWVPKSPGGFARMLHLFSFAVCSLPLMLRHVLWRADVVVTVAPALMCAPAGLLVARLSGSTAVLHLQDFEVDVAFQLGLLKGRLLKQAVLGAESWLLRRFDVVSSISQRMLDLLRTKGVPSDRVQFFPNWVDIDHVQPLTGVSSYRAELGIATDAIVVLFSGTMGGKQGLMVIPEAARLLSARADIHFVLCGNGVMKAPLEAACADLLSVHFLPLQPFDRLSQLLGMADIHVLPQSPEAEDLVLPSKLSGMLASGRPVIATCRANTEIANVVSQCGLVVLPEDGVALAHAVESLAADAERRVLLGNLGRAYAEHHIAREAVLWGWLEELASRVKSLRTTSLPEARL